MTAVLLSKHLAWFVEAGYWSRHLGRLMTPRSFHDGDVTGLTGMTWAADNDAFCAWDEGRYLTMLEALDGTPGCRFVTLPDVVADHEATLALWHEWLDVVACTDLPPAFVLQDGATVDTVPWADAAAVFIGGSTAWKLGVDAAELAAEAKRRGLWVHMGRVNSRRRLRYARAIGCDSVDGTGGAKYPDNTLRPMLAELATPVQGALALTA